MIASCRAPLADLGLDEGVEPAAQPVVGDPDRGAQAAQPGRGRVEQLADRIEAAGQARLEGRQRVELARELAQQRPAFLGQDPGQPAGRLEGLGDLEEVGRIQAAAPGCPLDPRPDVVGRADPGAGALAQQPPGLVGLVQAPAHDRGLVGRLEGLGEAPAGSEAGVVGEARPDRPELEQLDRLGVHQPDTLGVAGDRESPRLVGPGLAGEGDPDSRRRPDLDRRLGGRTWLEVQDGRRIEQVRPGQAQLHVERGPDQARPAASRCGAVRSRRRRTRSRSAGPKTRWVRASAASRAARISSTPSIGSTARMRIAWGTPAGPVTTFRQSIHAVHKIDVGAAGPARTSAGCGRSGRSGRGTPGHPDPGTPRPPRSGRSAGRRLIGRAPGACRAARGRRPGWPARRGRPTRRRRPS